MPDRNIRSFGAPLAASMMKWVEWRWRRVQITQGGINMPGPGDVMREQNSLYLRKLRKEH